MTCRPDTSFLWPYPTVLAAGLAGFGDAPGTPKMENEVAGEAELAEGGTDMTVDEADFVEVKYVS